MTKNKEKKTVETGEVLTKELDLDEEIGKKGLTAVFDRPRFLKLDLLAVSWIEDNVIPGRALAINGILLNLARIGFLKIVLQGALGMEHNEPRVKAEELQDIYDGYIENTGHLEDLQALLLDVYALFAKNPTKLAAAKKAAADALKELEKAKTKAKEDPGGGR